MLYPNFPKTAFDKVKLINTDDESACFAFIKNGKEYFSAWIDGEFEVEEIDDGYFVQFIKVEDGTPLTVTNMTDDELVFLKDGQKITCDWYQQMNEALYDAHIDHQPKVCEY